MKFLSRGVLSSPEQTFDPRVKIAWLLTNAGIVIWQQTITHLSLTLIMVLLINRLIGCSLTKLKPFLKMSALLGLQLILLQGFLHPLGTRLFTVGGVAFFSGGMLLGLRGIMMVSCLTLLFFQFLFWTSAREIILVLIRMRLPFKYAFTAGLAVRYLQLLQQDLRSIYQSQLSRGLRLDGYLKKIIGLPPIMIPLILKTLKRVEGITLSMELKAFGHDPQVTLMKKLHFRGKDLLAFLAIAVYGSLMIVME